jgi:hypothetical protein
MKSFKEFRKNKIEPKGTLNVFDVDETLFKTFSTIKVMKDGHLIKSLTNQEFNTYKIGKGETYDFGQFRDAAHFKATSKPMTNMIDRAKNIIDKQNKHSKTILLTARADFDDREMFLQTFRDHGFPIDQTHVERAGNIGQLNPNIRANITKMVVLRKYINSGKYNKIRIYDDSKTNLDSIVKLGGIHPNVKIEPWLVNHDGTIKKHK